MSLKDRILVTVGHLAARLGFLISVAAVILTLLHKINGAVFGTMLAFATVVCGGVAMLCYLMTGIE